MPLFLSRKSKVDRSRVVDWLSLSSSDGEIHPNELHFIAALAADHGVSKADFDAAVSKPGKVRKSDIGNNDEQFRHLLDLIHIMLIDGKVQEAEMDVVKGIAMRLGFPASAIDKVTATLVDAIKKAGADAKDIEINDSELEAFRTGKDT